MIIEIYAILTIISIALTAAGYYKQIPFMQIAGYSVFIILAIVLSGLPVALLDNNGIEYQTGSTINTTNPNLYTTTNIYQSYTNQTYGIILIMTGTFLIGTIILDPKVKFK